MHKPEDRSFIGHPRDLSYIAFRAAWERFSSFGMQSLLVLYMVHRLLYPGHIERIAGSATKVSIGWLVTFHVLNSIGFADIFRCHSRSMRAPPQPHCLRRSSAFIISRALPRITS